jgi:hypothetical protein
MNWIAAGSVVLWFILAFWLGGSSGAGAVFVMSIVLAIGLGVTRIAMWTRYRRDMRAELSTPPQE